MKQVILVLFALSVLAVSTVYSATPTAINFQGRLTTAAGTAVPDGNYSVAFTIYDAVSGGTSKWAETQSVTTSSGLFAVLLGTTLPILDTVFSGPSRYLGVKVGTDPELSPRTWLLTVPYANRTSTVDGSTGGSISGNIYLDGSSPSGGNVFKAGHLFLQNAGFNNTFLGQDAGPLALSGEGNSGFGAHVLQALSSGANNTGGGFLALASTQDGGGNTAFGASSLQNNISGGENSGFGLDALATNSNGYYNSAVGSFSLAANSSGSYNSALGYASLRSNSSGAQNTATGVTSLYSNSTGNRNSALGYEALFNNTTGRQNVASGSSALFANTIGFFNVALGDSALCANVDGALNTALGRQSLLVNSSGVHNLASGVYSLDRNTTGSYNTGCGSFSLEFNVSGSDNTALGYSAGVSGSNFTNSTAIGFQASANASNKIRLGNTNVTVIEGQVAYTFTSDRNQKENFQPVDGEEVLNKIQDLNLTSWNYKNNDPVQFRHYGPVAQEFYAAFGHDAVGSSGDSISINSGDEAGIMMIAIKTLAKRTSEIGAVRAENRELRSQLDDLKKAVSELEVQSRLTGNSRSGSK